MIKMPCQGTWEAGLAPELCVMATHPPKWEWLVTPGWKIPCLIELSGGEVEAEWGLALEERVGGTQTGDIANFQRRTRT